MLLNNLQSQFKCGEIIVVNKTPHTKNNTVLFVFQNSESSSPCNICIYLFLAPQLFHIQLQRYFQFNSESYFAVLNMKYSCPVNIK